MAAEPDGQALVCKIREVGSTPIVASKRYKGGLVKAKITSFMFRTAQYEIQSGQVKVLLTMDYAGNTFRINNIDGVADLIVLREVERVANDLLSRKHNVNFAYKFQ